MTPQMPTDTTTYEDVLVKEIHVDARPETVFAFFTEPAKMTQWLCEAAELDPRPGGICHQTHRDDDGVPHEMVGEYVELDPPHRVTFTWAFSEGSLHSGDDSKVTVELRPDGDGTAVTLSHYGARSHRADRDGGWSRLLPRLAGAVRTDQLASRPNRSRTRR
jgi:uncharacterized protein YndB with AHSA1/START domain